MNLQDTYRHRGLRKKLVELLQEKGITSKGVLDAINKVPRHFFLDNAFMESAYLDQAFQIGEEQTITQPYTVAYQSQLLDIHKGDKVLEVGTGSGYQACILAELGAKVFSIERNKKLKDRAVVLLDQMGYATVKIFFGDGLKGLPKYAPFNKIIITAAANEIPTKLIEQLSSNGKLVMPVGTQEIQKMALLEKDEHGEHAVELSKSFKFVPLLPGKVH